MKQLVTFILAICTLTFARAQQPVNNTAFKNGESVNYILKYNWGAIWIDVGTASWNIVSSSYAGQTGHKVTLRTSTNKRADKYFVLRDTMTTYVNQKVVPLYFEKRGREEKRYNQEWVKYTYSGGKCNISSWQRTDQKPVKTNKYSSTTCAYDMVSMLLRARSMNPKGWKVGHRESFILAEGRKCSKQSIVYRGAQTIKLEGSGMKYRCLVFSFMENENGKESEIVKFFISDDANHLPVRLDLNLRFGSAKAFMTSCSGLRNPQNAKL